jgi:hypothetical protein
MTKSEAKSAIAAVNELFLKGPDGVKARPAGYDIEN